MKGFRQLCKSWLLFALSLWGSFAAIVNIGIANDMPLTLECWNEGEFQFWWFNYAHHPNRWYRYKGSEFGNLGQQLQVHLQVLNAGHSPGRENPIAVLTEEESSHLMSTLAQNGILTQQSPQLWKWRRENAKLMRSEFILRTPRHFTVDDVRVILRAFEIGLEQRCANMDNAIAAAAMRDGPSSVPGVFSSTSLPLSRSSTRWADMDDDPPPSSPGASSSTTPPVDDDPPPSSPGASSSTTPSVDDDPPPSSPGASSSTTPPFANLLMNILPVPGGARARLPHPTISVLRTTTSTTGQPVDNTELTETTTSTTGQPVDDPELTGTTTSTTNFGGDGGSHHLQMVEVAMGTNHVKSGGGFSSSSPLPDDAGSDAGTKPQINHGFLRRWTITHPVEFVDVGWTRWLGSIIAIAGASLILMVIASFLRRGVIGDRPMAGDSTRIHSFSTRTHPPETPNPLQVYESEDYKCPDDLAGRSLWEMMHPATTASAPKTASHPGALAELPMTQSTALSSGSNFAGVNRLHETTEEGSLSSGSNFADVNRLNFAGVNPLHETTEEGSPGSITISNLN